MNTSPFSGLSQALPKVAETVGLLLLCGVAIGLALVACATLLVPLALAHFLKKKLSGRTPKKGYRAGARLRALDRRRVD